jgi:phospholipase C
MEPLTARDAAAADLWHLLSEPKPRRDCPMVLNNPALIVLPDDQGTIDADLDDLPLPQSGNLIGFLHILHKAEREIAARTGQSAADLAAITTHGHARDYVGRVWDMVKDHSA